MWAGHGHVNGWRQHNYFSKHVCAIANREWRGITNWQGQARHNRSRFQVHRYIAGVSSVSANVLPVYHCQLGVGVASKLRKVAPAAMLPTPLLHTEKESPFTIISHKEEIEEQLAKVRRPYPWFHSFMNCAGLGVVQKIAFK